MCLIHKYESIGTQTHYHFNIMRDVSICKKCGKLKYTMFDIGITRDKYFLHEHDWRPEIDITQYKRDIKLNKLLK